MPTVAARGQGTPTTAGAGWTSATSAVDGAPGTNPWTFAQWQSAVPNAVGSITVTGYSPAFAAIPDNATITSVTVKMGHLGTVAALSGVAFQPYAGATPIGTARTVTVPQAPTVVSAAFPVTVAQLKAANFSVRATATRASTGTPSTWGIDYLDVEVAYTGTPWTPGMAWPSGTAGGAAAPSWGGHVRLWVRAGLAPGRTFHMGAHADDRLDAGNVLGGATIGPAVTTGDRLWIDLSCDVTEVEIAGGAASSAGIFSKADAATLTATLADPAAKYDPLNSGGPFSYGGRSRLVPGVPVEAFAEVVDGATGTWARFPIFSGTADSWGEDWTANPREREAKLIATDATKTWARYNRPEQPLVGGGDTVAQRIHRIVEFFAWPGIVEDPPGGSSRTLQATTLAQPGWELLNRATDDELGVIYLTADGRLRWLNRETWATITEPVLVLGCASLPAIASGPGFDVLVDATPSTLDLQLRNDVHAARSGGISQQATSTSSVATYGPYGFQRTDLGLADDVQVGQWASRVVELYAFPQVALADVTLVPGIDAASDVLWPQVLDLALFTDLVRIRWAPPDLPTHQVDGEVRVVGFRHRISRAHWEVTWQTLAARPLQLSGSTFTIGPHARDRLDAGMVMG